MNTLDAASLVNLLGFAVAIALYGMLAAMVVRHRRAEDAGVNMLLLVTSLLGLLWNFGELFLRLQSDFASLGAPALIDVISYSALGFLPSVVVHSAYADTGKKYWLAYAAYCSSALAAILHFESYLTGGPVPSGIALKVLTFSALALAIALVTFNFKQTLEKKSVWASALLVFAVSALHLGGNREGNSWLIELVAHQSSLPLVLVILYQNYRFAFADLFLKRALSLIFLALVALGLYVWVAAPLLRYHETHDRNDVQAISIILVLWIATALIYPSLHKLAVAIVDKGILKRADYGKLQIEVERSIEKIDSVEDVLREVAVRLANVLTANKADWKTSDAVSGPPPGSRLDSLDGSVAVDVRTAEPPFYRFELGDFQAGRRLLSDEMAMLDTTALLAARRIDAIRVTRERYEREIREEEFAKLAAEAQLTALRSQINPHFLFNALTTIGFLIQTAPEKASQTLLHLTKLLRGVLSSTSEFCSLGEEMNLIESYLDIERARFEERLAVNIDIDEGLKSVRIPSLILQPLVENAIKHGISENRAGGRVNISARIDRNIADAAVLTLSVSDTGPGKSRIGVADISTGTGLSNIRQRLDSYYGKAAGLSVKIGEANGTTATISLPVAAGREGS
ncbi:MAG TPA: histidine kinase [Pyrinomonadaceae bacterium]|nr:histidine kinase [Pyrinomonadaceae bacterium]